MQIDLTNQMMKGACIQPNASFGEFMEQVFYEVFGDPNTREELLGPEGDNYESLAKNFWCDEMIDEKPGYILDLLEAKGWMRVKDNFADKVIKSMQWPASTPALDSDEFRVTIYIKNKPKGGKPYMDIRPWGRWNNS